MMGQYHFYSSTLWNNEVKKKDNLIREVYMLYNIDMTLFYFILIFHPKKLRKCG